MTLGQGLGRQRGQALVETALALPLLALLTLGLLMLGHLLWLRVRLQAAAQAAARAYTVWQPENSETALQKAQAAAWLALRPQPRGSAVKVVLPPWRPRSTFEDDGHRRWLSSGPLAHTLEVHLKMRPLPFLVAIWPDGPTLKAHAVILSENSVEREKLLR